MVATFAIAVAGVAIGAFAAYVGQYGAAARAARTIAPTADLRDDPSFANSWLARDAVVQEVLKRGALERFPAPQIITPQQTRPKIIIVLDDMGIDKRAFERVMQLPGPLTLSFLPYAEGVRELAQKAQAADREVMLHLPMAPYGDADPGPHALDGEMLGTNFIKELEWNLERLDGFVGVNNHMGSKLTADEAAMKTLLAHLNQRGLFFLDSVTTGETTVRRAGAKVGARVFSRDVFLDAEVSDAAAIQRRLGLVEQIARETGFAVAIGHPKPETIDVLGPWLASAPYRGFDLAPASALIDIEQDMKPPILAEAPNIRL